MFEWGLSVEYPLMLDYPSRYVKKAMLHGASRAVRYWHSHMLPKHFREGAAQKYGYQKRSAGYRKRKLKTRGHSKDLVWSGIMGRKLTRMLQIKVNQARLTVDGKMKARALKLEGRENMPPMSAEVTMVTNEEMSVLGRIAARAAARWLQKHGVEGKKTRRKLVG
jgi:hypothetical protein